jgi:hypothetical protein
MSQMWERSVMLNKGRTNVRDEQSGCPFLITEDLKNRIDHHIRTTGISLLLKFMRNVLKFHVCWFLKLLRSISTTKKICARWVPWLLTEEHKGKHMGAALKFFEHYPQEGDNFLDQIVIGDETWISHNIIPEIKCHSLEWHHSHSLSKFKQTLSTWKMLAAVFFGTRKSSFWLNSCPKAEPSMLHRIVQLWLRRTIQYCQWGKLSTGVVLLRDNTHPYTCTAIDICALLADFA